VNRIVIMTALALALSAGSVSGLIGRDITAHDAQAADAAGITPPDTPVGAQVAWVLGILNDKAGALSEEELTAHFAPELLAVLPPEQLVGTFQQLAALAPFDFQGFTRPPVDTQAVSLLAGAGGVPFVLPLAVETATPHRITNPLFRVATRADSTVSSTSAGAGCISPARAAAAPRWSWNRA
jgi:hypothetical protein